MLNSIRYSVILGSLLAAFYTNAQVYTGANFPTAGTDYVLYSDTTAYQLDVNILEGNAPWYLTSSGYDFLDTIEFVNPSSTPFATEFPTADISITDDNNNDFMSKIYLEDIGGNLYTLGGSVTPPSEIPLPFVYDEPLSWLNFPMQLGSFMYDTAYGRIAATGAEVGVPADSVRLVSTVFRHDTIDAVGALYVPGLILENTIRRIRTDSILDSLFTKTAGVWSYDPNLNEGINVEKYIDWFHQDESWMIAQAMIRDNQVRNFRFLVGPPPSIRLEFSNFITDISILDTIQSFQVTAFDIQSGSIVTDFPDSIRVSAFPDTSQGWSYWQLDETSILPTNGVATFESLWFYEPGDYQLLAWSDTALADTSMLITVHPVASHLDLNTSNLASVENQPLSSFTVSALNEDESVDALFYQGSVRVGKISGSGELLGTYTQPLINGVATFNDIGITKEGAYGLVFYTPLEQHYLVQDTMWVTVSPNAGTWNYHYTDTLDEYIERANEFVWFGNADGYLSGTGRGSYSEVGQHFDFQGEARMTKLLCHFANRLHVGDDTDTFEIRVYDAGLLESSYASNQDITTFMDSVPLTLIGSQYFLADSMRFGDYWIRNITTIEFDNPPLINSSFVVSLVGDSELSNDTIMLWHSVPGDAQQEYRTVRLMNIFGDPQDPDTSWVRDKYWRPSFDVDIMISPVLEVDTLSTIISVSEMEQIELEVYPNPTTGFIGLNWENPEVYQVEVYTGSQVLEKHLVETKKSLEISLMKYASGNYQVFLRNKQGRLLATKKVVKID